MTADIQTMIWKESKGLFRREGNRLRFFFTLLTPLLVIGIFLPWQLGTDWANSFWSLLCGQRTAAQLADQIADCWMSRTARTLLDCLFPQFTGQVWAVGGGG